MPQRKLDCVFIQVVDKILIQEPKTLTLKNLWHCLPFLRAFDVELLYIAQQLKITLAEVAINWTEIDGLSQDNCHKFPFLKFYEFSCCCINKSLSAIDNPPWVCF